jgi:hypothetical protein
VKGLCAIGEAVASLKASGKHDRIIAKQASIAQDTYPATTAWASRWRLDLIPYTRE